jgi:hypothetical protein
MDELILDNGKTITFDLSKVSHKDYTRFWRTALATDATPKDEQMTEAEQSAFWVKVCGLTLEEIDALAEMDWRRFRAEWQRICFRPLEEHAKNSQSESTTPTSG